MKITKKDLYNFSADFGMMLSWGISAMKCFEEIGKGSGHPFFKNISLQLSDSIIQGSNISEVIEKYPEVFKPVFTRWVKLGEKFGILDNVLLEMAGIIRFDFLLTGKNSLMNSQELGAFLLKLKEFMKNQNNGRIPEEISDNRLLTELVEKMNNNSGKLFINSQKYYLNEPVYRKIAGPLLWHLLETSESCGYLEDMLEILGLYLTDKNNILPTEKTINMKEETFSEKESCLYLAEKLINITKGSKDKKITIRIKNDEFIISVDGKEKSIDEVLHISSSTRKRYGIVNTIKNIFDMDVAEKCLTQYMERKYSIEGVEYMLSAKVTPPWNLEDRKRNDMEKGIEIIEIETKFSK